MKNRLFIEQKHIFPLLAVLSAALLIIVVVCGWFQDTQADEHAATDITQLNARSEDCSISLSWSLPHDIAYDQIELKIEATDHAEQVLLNRNETSYTFTGGVHGKKYRFSVTLQNESQYVGQVQKVSALFLDWAQLPDLPIVRIETRNGELPTYSTVNAPEDQWGISITDNEYVWAQITIERQGTVLMRGATQLRVRGNTSATSPKTPYKLKLETAEDLLFRGNDAYKDREWALVADNHTLRLEAGTKVSELCGSQWQPAYQSVNVIVNGNWMGAYHLIETVKRSSARVDLSTDGFLIENDAYWWNAGDAYIHTPKQNSHMGYTFGYPSDTDITEAQKEAIYNYISVFERALLEGEGNYADYIDVDSFASWLLAHDILGTWDSAGSNMFLCKYSADPDSKLKMGPGWDFDTIFTQDDAWSRIHNSSIMYYSTLLKQSDFVSAYKQQWEALSPTIAQQMQTFIDDLYTAQGQALQESWDLDMVRWSIYTQKDVQQVAQSVKDWFISRTDWLNTAVDSLK